ncbi:hypothetical protein D3C81_1443040 [compost metagenome]
MKDVVEGLVEKTLPQPVACIRCERIHRTPANSVVEDAHALFTRKVDLNRLHTRSHGLEPFDGFVEGPVGRDHQVIAVLCEQPRQFIADPGGGAGHNGKRTSGRGHCRRIVAHCRLHHILACRTAPRRAAFPEPGSGLLGRACQVHPGPPSRPVRPETAFRSPVGRRGCRMGEPCGPRGAGFRRRWIVVPIGDVARARSMTRPAAMPSAAAAPRGPHNEEKLK